MIRRKNKEGGMAAEIRFSITDRFNKMILSVCEKYGIDKAEYIKSLIIKDLRTRDVEE